LGIGRKVNNTSLSSLLSYDAFKARRLLQGSYVIGMVENRNVYRILVGNNPVGKRPLGNKEENGSITLRYILGR
jgi:hypothetical protein